MRLLDLFCGAGGCAVGYHRAGFEVVGVDIKPQPHYPFEFHQADALTFPLDGFDVAHASPPCQAHSALRAVHPDRQHPDLVAPTRERLKASGLPWIMENVPGAPLSHAVILCGSMFGLGVMSGDGVRTRRAWRQLRRHRLFESSHLMLQPYCEHDGSESLGVYGHGGAVGRTDSRRGGFQGTAEEKRQAMGIDWMTGNEVSQAIPPAYTEFLGLQLAGIVADRIQGAR